MSSNLSKQTFDSNISSNISLFENTTTTIHPSETTKTLSEKYSELVDNETIFFLKFYEETRHFERLVGIIIPSIFALFALFGLVGNLLVVIVALNRQMRNSTNTLIIGLTCSDLMFLTLCIPFTAIDYAFPIWVLPTWMCPLINYLQHSSAYFSVWTLTLMAADRFLAVVFPVESMTLRTPKNTFFVLLIVYTVILFSQIQVGRIHGVYSYTFIMEQRSACSIVSIAQGLATVAEARLYFFSFNIFGYCLPLGITCVLYYLMLKRLWYAPFRSSSDNNTKTIPPTKLTSLFANNSERSNCSLRSRPETIKAKRKVTRLVLCVVIIWAVCWLPLNLCFFASGVIYPDTLVLRGGKPIVVVQIFSQVSENFRKGFLRVLSTLANWLSCGHCCKQFHLYNTRMELTILNRTNSNKSKNAISKSNSKNTTGSTKTTTNQAQSAYEPSMFSLLHRASLPKRCSAVSIAERLTTTSGNGCSTARIRILSRGESASYLSVGTTNLLNFPSQQTTLSRRQSKIIFTPITVHRPSRHSLLDAKRSGENIERRENSEQRRHSNEEKIIKNEEEKKILILKEEEFCEYKFEDGDLEI
uniref:G_PROTEIN_RECEP_F1_2 domain-containing protein n=1 Tax=Meloidogyne hapla TaxID=6305 RepID=A0A1I8BZA1_MELHA